MNAEKAEGVAVISWNELHEGTPVAARVLDVPLVVVRLGDVVHVLHSRCPHRGADLSRGKVEAGCIVCPEHGWEFSCATGETSALFGDCIRRFESWVEDDRIFVDSHALLEFSSEQDTALSYAL